MDGGSKGSIAEAVPAVPARNSSSRIRGVLIASGVLVLFLLGVAVWFVSHITPLIRERAIRMLGDRFQSEVEIEDLQVSAFPTISISGKGLALRHHGRTDVPPLITIAEFEAHESWWSLTERPWHIHQVRLRGLSLHIPPRNQRNHKNELTKWPQVPVLVDELIADNTELDILPNDPDKLPHVFLIHQLTMHSVGMGRAAPFHAVLTNPTPPGDITSDGKFGPWNGDEPRLTAVSGNYTFTDADLGALRGIAGILSSTGKYEGVLESITVEGETKTPDFQVNLSGHPVSLKTQYSATVDGTNGNTFLHPVIASFLHSTLEANGAVVKAAVGKGREIQLRVEAKDARLEDLLRLAVKADKPIMTGSVSLSTLFDLPPGEEDLADRLRLHGRFGVNGGRFSDEGVRGRIESLSRRAQGKPKDEDAGSAVSDLAGQFDLQRGVITFHDLSFRVDGASVQLDGTYALRTEELDFHGHLRADAKLSQMTTGFKSFLLKPFDGFFRKEGKTYLPIKITGTRNSPTFGLELRRKQ